VLRCLLTRPLPTHAKSFVAGRSPRRHRKPHPQQAKSQELKNAQEIDAGNRMSRKSNSPGGAPGGKHSTARLENEMRSKPDDFFFYFGIFNYYSRNESGETFFFKSGPFKSRQSA
jgi:hypothetical protein